MILGILGIVIALGIAWWQYRDAVRAKAALKTVLDAMPSKVADALHQIVGAYQHHRQTHNKLEGVPSLVDYVDVDGDGKQELLVQYPTGAHGSALKVFGWKNWEFIEIASISVGTPVGFDFGDFDNDGRIEIKTEETDWTSGLCYAKSPSLTFFLRWNGEDFVEVARSKSLQLP